MGANAFLSVEALKMIMSKARPGETGRAGVQGFISLPVGAITDASSYHHTA